MGNKYYIAVDCEGVACTVGAVGQGLSSTENNYHFACLQATREANAAAKALFDFGAKEVYVWDAHWMGTNLNYDMLDKRCNIVLGSGHNGRFVGLDESFDGVLFIGYHSKEGTKDAVLAHTFSSRSFQYYRLDGKEVGELEIDAAYAGAHDVPVLFCASDDKCVAEAKAAFGNIATVTTKKSLSWTSAISRHPEAVCEDIYATVLEAAKKGNLVKPYTFPKPLDVEIRFQRMDGAAQSILYDMNGKPFSFTDAYTRKGTIASVLDLF